MTKTTNQPSAQPPTAAAMAANDRSPRPINHRAVLISLMMIAISVAGIFLAINFVEDERKRELNQWQIRLGIVADTRVAAINDWTDEQIGVLRELTQNASLQLYMTELAVSDDFGFEDEQTLAEDVAAQTQYLRNLLVATAERAGFVTNLNWTDIEANVERVGVAGLGLVDASGVPLVATPGMPAMNARIKNAVTTALAGEPALIDIYLGASGQPTVGFVLPVFSLQGDDTDGVGAVVGIKLIDDGFWGLLEQPGETESSAATYLVRYQQNTIEYISALDDEAPPLSRKMAKDTPDLASAFALDHPGGFATKRDYNGTDVLITSRAIAQFPWTLVRTISSQEALAASETRLKTILVVFILSIIGVALTILAVWRHGSSLRATEAAHNFKVSAERFESLSKFMKLVTNSQPHGIAAVDGKARYTFANTHAAEDGGITPEDMLGKTMASVIGPVKSSAYDAVNRSVLERGQRQTKIHTFDVGNAAQVVQSDHIPLQGDRDRPAGVLMILNDITELTKERKRAEQMLRELIDTLVSVVDRRDPWSANHSNRVAHVAKSIAEEMGLKTNDQKIADIAGSLMNLGKIFVPHDLLVKRENLTEEERELLSHSYLVSVDLLEGVTFDGPVVDTIRQMGETWDGNGPLGLKGDEILKTSRILSVANAFVGMVSARAYRSAMTFENATALLVKDVGKKFDRKPVSALINYLENRGGVEEWAHFREKPMITEPGGQTPLPN